MNKASIMQQNDKRACRLPTNSRPLGSSAPISVSKLAFARRRALNSPPLGKGGGRGGYQAHHANAADGTCSLTMNPEDARVIGEGPAEDPPNPPLPRGGENGGRFTFCHVAVLVGILSLLAATPSPAQETHLFKAARIWSGSSPVYVNGALLVRDGKIVAAGKLQGGKIVAPG